MAEELLACTRIIAHQAVQRGGHGAGAGLLHAAQRHAEVLGLEDDPHALGPQLVLQARRDLRREALLQLKAAGEEVDHACELREPQDALRGEVGDVGDAVERQDVVHAQRLERDLTHDDELVVALVVGEGRQVERLGREQLGVRVRHPARRLAQALVVEIGTERGEQLSRGAFHAVAIDRAREMGHGEGCGHAAFVRRRRRFLPRAILMREQGEQALVVLGARRAAFQVRAHAGNRRVGARARQLELDVAVELVEAALAGHLRAVRPEEARQEAA